MTNEQTAWSFNPMTPTLAWARTLAASYHALSAARDVSVALTRYSNEFATSFWTSVAYFGSIESRRVAHADPLRAFAEYTRLGGMNLELFWRALDGSSSLLGKLSELERERAVGAIVNTFLGADGEDIEQYWARQAAVARMVASDFPQAVAEVEKDYGFHFERYDEGPFAETDRFVLWRVQPTDPSVRPEPGRKPLIIVPPYVLGANILAFLPKEGRSYAHAFANQGIPTYIRIMKDINENEAVQVMVGEDDTMDTRYFCEQVMAAHGAPVTLNGYCQGGYSSLCNLLSGELDGLVDALITCVSPMDGTYSDGLKGFLERLPPVFNDLDYGIRTLPNGNRVADGRLMGWVYKLKSIEAEGPMNAYLRDLLMFAGQQRTDMKLSKSAAAINYWLANERTDLPLSITDLSFASYNIPISDDGVLPVKLFGRELKLDRLVFKDIPWLICYGERDDLVEKECALAPAEHVDVEVTEFPRGHVAIATSWSHPDSACALHTRFGENDRYRGPVRWHLDFEQAQRNARD